MSAKIFNEEVGLLREGSIVGYDSTKRVALVKLTINEPIQGNYTPVEVSLPNSLFYNNGLFIGAYPDVGTPVVIQQGSGGKYYFIGSLTNGFTDEINLDKNKLIIKSSSLSKIEMSTSHEISIGSDDNNLQLDANLGYYSNSYNNQYSFSYTSNKINSIIKREKYIDVNSADFNKIRDNKNYLSKFTVGFDPKTQTNYLTSSTRKNPPLNESRELIYEYPEESNVLDDFSELLIYKNLSNKKNYSYPDRTKFRSNTLNLNLNYPNQLIEIIKGTVVDIFGNVVDINRYPISFDNNSSLKSENKEEAFKRIKALQRKGIALHFELNARKDLYGNSGQISLPDINSNSDNSRNRSRFYIDVDKEGQFKINIPASSETGNVPLLTRYENFSYLSQDDNNNPNKLIFRDDGLDILHDSFGFGQISIKSENGESSPLDRIKSNHIKLGTAHHDIFSTCIAHQSLDFINYQHDTTIQLDNSYISKDFVGKEIITSGNNANAGGRSGQINLDGSLELNVGANTIDRQSLWLDTAGGMIANIGRDKNNNSAIFNLDGNMIVQIGGLGVSNDSRFSGLNNGYIGGTLDIRVMRPGFQATMLRIDQEGIKVLTAGRMMFHANSDIVIKSDATMTLEAENMVIQERFVLKGGPSI
ncbi:MAG: hypothetical protein LC122_13190 [Chitinophagales bacterium]|nr:hypothetical protein [Chitinophagales bacterium]